MKKSLIALAVLGATAGAAQAQSSVVIYGSADISYVKASGSSVTMSGGAERVPFFGTASDNTYMGFMGTEDLGGGLKATFQLEKRFNLANGLSSAYGDFEGAANVGLSGSFGQIRFGRVNELSTETYRRIDPFDQNGVAGMLTTPLRGDDLGGRLSSTARYDSPNIKGFNFGASYTLKDGDAGPFANVGYALSATYGNDPAYLVANYNKAANSGDSHNWNLGGAYAFGPARLSLGYGQTQMGPYLADMKLSNWIIGLSYTVGNGVINASYNDGKSSLFVPGPDVSFDTKTKKYAFGYTHNLSKRTSVYANYAHLNTRYTIDGLQDEPISTSESERLFEVGITHKF